MARGKEVNGTENKAASPISKIVIAVAIFVIVVCAVIAGVSLAFMFTGHGEVPDPKVSEQVIDPAPVETSSPGMSIYDMNISGCYALTRLVGLVEDADEFGTTPAYVFVGQMVVETADAGTAPDAGNYDATMELKVRATREVLQVARDAAAEWNIPYEALASYLTSSSCIHLDKYIILIGDNRYAPMAQEFEAAVEAPTVLDFEDLVARLASFTAGGK